MVYTPLTNRAMVIAYNAHHGQIDYNGIPYIFHPLHLAEQMNDEISCCVALLHDTVEDTPVTLEELQKEFPAAVTDAIALLPMTTIRIILIMFAPSKAIPLPKKLSLRTWNTIPIKAAVLAPI